TWLNKAGILLNEKLRTLIDKADRMDGDLRQVNERLTREPDETHHTSS
ncbi:MAG: hypothetical protein HKP44_03645, partial [Desulfofustis sp.]|nr:hypothetical protein [Desulfofustis sp.]